MFRRPTTILQMAAFLASELLGSLPRRGALLLGGQASATRVADALRMSGNRP